MKPTRKLLIDIAERTLWTAAEAGLAYLAVASQNWSGQWVPIFAAGLAGLKGFVAGQIGDKQTASTVELLPKGD